MTFAEIFTEIAALLVVAAVVGAVAVRLRQPLIVAYLAVGILVGPAVLGLVTATEEIELLAELGIALLLFIVGLKLDIRLIRTTGRVALATGLGQVAFTSIFGFGICLALGLELVTSIYVAVAITFSSTIIIVKLLSDKREIDDLHGRIAVGFLIVQDIVVVLAMIVITAAGAGAEGDLLQEIVFVLLRGAALLAALALLMRYVLTPVLHRLAHSPELLILASVAWGVGLAATADELGFSIEVGAFLGGVALASTPYREAIGSRLVPLRDFLLLFFFIDLGLHLDLAGLVDQLGSAVVLSLFVLIGNPLIVLVIMGLMGYRKRVSFLAGLTVSQISEFSLILGALGVGVGHIEQDALMLITAVGLMTISASTYAILYSHRIYGLLEPWLKVFERRRDRYAGEDPEDGPPAVDVIVCGIGRYGNYLARSLSESGHRVLVVDFDAQAIEQWRSAGGLAMYGDVEDPELPGSLPLGTARWVVSTVARHDANVGFLHALRQYGYKGRVAVTVHHDDEAEDLRRRGADVVLMPFQAAVKDTVGLLSKR